MATPTSPVVHLLAADTGLDTAGELASALEAGGSAVHDHRLTPRLQDAENDDARLREELARAEAAVRAAAADGGRLLLVDDRGALAVALLLRLLLDERGLGWEEAWARTRSSIHVRFGCPGSQPSRPFCRVEFLEAEEPRLLEILFELNRRHLDEVEVLWPGDGGRRRRLSLFREGEGRRLRLGHLAILGAGHVRVAPPWEGPAAEILADFTELRGPAIEACATPVVARPLVEANPPLAELLGLTLGAGWAEDAGAFRRLESLAFQASFRGAFRKARRANRERLGALLRGADTLLDPESLVDVRLGRLAGRERPLLSVLGLVREHLRLAAGFTPPAPRTVVIARPRDGAWPDGERLLALLQSVARAINDDERARGALRVAVLPDCDRSAEQLLLAGADLANEPGIAGSGAAGARALRFASSGAVLLGTRDGTLRELAAALGPEALFLFGLGPLETHAWREGQVYRPRDVYAIDPLVRLTLDALASGRYTQGAGGLEWVREALFDPGDPWLVLADLGAYVHRQDEALAEFADPRTFTEKAILTLAGARRFWVERTP